MDMGGGVGRVINHPEYYLSDGSVSFLMGNTLFRVHKSFFERESEFFRELFADAAKEDPQSGTDSRPFTPDVGPDEFAHLLWVWYDSAYSYQRQPKQKWITILQLSTRWRFARIRELAVRELEALELPPAERISIYNEHGIDGEQLLSSYVEICKSPTLPSAAEGELMQMETLIKVLQARENAQRKAIELGHESPTSASLRDETLREIVTNFFNTGLNPRSSGTSTRSGDQAPGLNGERAHGSTGSASTVMLQKPQVPDRTTTQPTSKVSQQSDNPTQTGGPEGQGSREMAKERGSGGGRPTTSAQDREKENQEKAKRAKEEKDKAEKAKQDKDKDQKERDQRTGQRSGGGSSR